MTLPLGDLEHDALTEVVNIGVGSAATHLSRLLSEEVLLTVPNVMIVSRDDAVMLLPDAGKTPLIAIRERFSGQFSGCALLIFPEKNSFEIVRAAIRSEFSLEEIGIFENEALGEIGNIILNGCLSAVANSLSQTLAISLPELLHGDGQAILFNGDGCSREELVLFAQVDFVLKPRRIQGFIVLTLDLPDLDELRKILQRMIDDIVKQNS